MNEDSPDLVGTPVAAATLGVTARTLQRYVSAGTADPTVRLPSGQYRWDLAELARQTAGWRTTSETAGSRDEQQPGTSEDDSAD